MYEMLAGQLPFVPPPGEPGLAAVLTRLSEPAPPLKSVIPGIDARWNDVVARCLEREIARRFASADDVVRALSDEVSGEGTARPVAARAAAAASAPASAAPSVAPSAAPRSAWRRVGLVVVGVGGLVALVAAFQHRPAPAGDSAKVAPVLAPSLSPSAPAEPPKAEAVAPPKIADEAAPDPSAAARPEAAAAVDRHPAARRPNAPRTLRRDPTATAAPKRGNNTPPAPTPTNAAEPDAPKPPKPRPRSADPNDGFIFQ